VEKIIYDVAFLPLTARQKGGDAIVFVCRKQSYGKRVSGDAMN
jgi:hypothetical protein